MGYSRFDPIGYANFLHFDKHFDKLSATLSAVLLTFNFFTVTNIYISSKSLNSCSRLRTEIGT